MNLGAWLKNLGEELLDLIYPRTCAYCGQLIDDKKSEFCPTCLNEFPYIVIGEEDIIERFVDRDILKGVTGLFYYHRETQVAEVIHQLKYRGRSQIGVELGEKLGEKLTKREAFKDVTCIVPVPLHKKRLRKRGYNQSRMIADGIVRVLDVPIREDIVIRRRNNTSQTKMERTQRKSNTEGLFEVQKGVSLKGEHVLIVDDVLTTGATISSLIDCLRNAGCEAISVATLGVVKGKGAYY